MVIEKVDKGISVIVCCYNSENRIPETIKHLAYQETSSQIKWEVIIVNNASSDTTSTIAYKESRKYKQLNDKFHIVDQPLAGLSHARELGVHKAQYEYVIFCDDDNWLDSKYLLNAYKIMESDPLIGALGGRSTAVTDAKQLPEWFESVENWYAVGSQGRFSGDISHTYNVWGAGMVTRKNLHIKCYPKEYPSLLSDRKGENLSAGGDTEFCLRLLLKGYKLYYDENLKFIHFIPKLRLTLDYKTRLQNGFLSAGIEMHKYSQLYQMSKKNNLFRFFLFTKILLGFLSTAVGRKSWKFTNVKSAFYYLTKIDKGIDQNTKTIYSFYKNYRF